MIRKLTFTVIGLFLFSISFSQAFLQNMPKEKNPQDYTLNDYRQAFDTYWDSYNVVNGYYTDREGNQQKAAYWKVFNRWYYYWESRVDATTSAFPRTTASEQYDIWEKTNPQSGSQGIMGGPMYASSWSSLGPDNNTSGYSGTGRLNCVAFHPSDNNTYWVGAPSGGLWVTANNGTNWTPLTDNSGYGAIGVSDIAIPSDYATSSTIYIATGDRDGGSMWSLGGGQSNDNNSIGVLKSIDGGSTWSTTGLTYTTSQKKMLSRLLINPSSTSILYVSGTDGILKSTDGGANWTNVYSTEVVIDIKFKPGDPTVLYASTKDYWGAVLVLVSTNSGSTWTTALTLATTDYRCDLGVSANNATYVYAVVATRDGGLKGLYKSTNSGSSYTQVYDGTATDHNLLGYYTDGSGGASGQGGYDLAIEVSPTDVDEVYIAGVITHKSTNGGTSWAAVNCWTSSSTYNTTSAPVVHADQHMLRYRSSDNALFEANDGGLYSTSNSGTSWSDLTGDLVISQLYRLSVSQTVSGDILGGLQDNGTKAKISGTWYDVKGGDGMDCHIDKNDVNNQYGAYVRGQISRTTAKWSGSETDISPSGKSGTGSWLTPYIIDPNNSDNLYAGYNNVYKTTDKGNTWSTISTMNTTDANGRGNLKTIAVAPSNSSVIYTADPTTIWVTTNGGSSWADISSGLPVSSNSITYITVKETDASTVWVTFGNYNSNRIYESTNGGTSWTDISSGLPSIPVMCVVQNILNTGQDELYVGTDVGVYLKTGSGNWVAYNTSLPNVVVNDLDIYYDGTTPANSRLYAGTSGRGVWVSALNSTGCTAPSTQASNFAASSITTSTMTISWTRGNGTNIIVLAKEGSAVDDNPVVGQSYTDNSVFGSGDQIGTGNYVVYDGTGASVNVSNLSSGTTVHYAIYEYNSTDNCFLFPAHTGSASTYGAPSVTTTAASSVASSSATSGGEVTNLNGNTLTQKGVCWSTSSNPTLADSYTDDISQGTGIGTYNSSITGLSASTTYYVRAYATNSSGTNYGNEESFITDCGLVNFFPYEESFEGTICWTINDVTGTSGDWSFSTGTVHPSGTSAQDGSKLAYFNSYTSNAGNETRIESPSIDLSSLESPMLSYWLYHETGYSSADDKIQPQIYSSNSWSDIGSSVSRYNGTTTWTRYTVDLSAYSGIIQLGFLATSDYGNDIHIDNIKVFDAKTITSGQTNKCSPDYIRNGAAGSLYFYDQYDFSVAVSGNYDITADWTTGTSFDGYIYLYSPSFDPDNPATNLIASNDDFGSSAASKIANQTLSASTDYIVIATTKLANNLGSTFEISVEGSSVITTSITTDYNGIGGGAGHSVAATDNTIRTSDYECDDINDWTHYYDDNATTSDYSDDKILLSVKRNSNDFGTTTVTIEGASGAAFIDPNTSPYVNTFNGWYVFNRFWELTPTSQPTSDINVRFYYTDGDFTELNSTLTSAGRSAVSNHTDMSFLKINDLSSSGYDADPTNGHTSIPKATDYNADGAWIYSNAASATTNRWAYGTYNGAHYGETVISHFSGGGGGAAGTSDDGSLPIELLSFDAFAIGDINQIVWKTASELNADRFIIERRNANDNSIEIVGTVKANGNSNILLQYSLNDINPLEEAYYRLKSIDIDGSSETYEWIYVKREANILTLLNLYPNPTETLTKIEFVSPSNEDIRIELRDVVGRVVKAFDYKAIKGIQIIDIDLKDLNSGTYYLSMDNKQTRIIRILLKK